MSEPTTEAENPGRASIAAVRLVAVAPVEPPTTKSSSDTTVYFPRKTKVGPAKVFVETVTVPEAATGIPPVVSSITPA
jgi:hypothetical protein